jgi:DNA-binding winged helix-turn-helix (wHTH) protein
MTKTTLYKFKDFEFDSTNLVLTKKGEAIDIRHNEAKVLRLLIERSDSLLNKEEILSLVWPNKVISEQAVFQNISHLRNLFGVDAIKTFPKRGYQWQLEFELVSPNLQPTAEKAQTSHQSTPSKQAAKQVSKRSYWLYGALASIVLVVIGAINLQTEPEQKNSSPIIKMAYVPISTSQDKGKITLDDNTHFDFTQLTHLTTSQFETSAELLYPPLANAHPLVLTAQMRTYNQQSYLDFTLKGPFADWQGQLSGSSKDDVIKQLQHHLKQTVIYDLLNKPQPPELRQANLSIAHQQSPDDLIILEKLISTYIGMGEDEKAMVMADKLVKIAQSKNNAQQTGNAFLYQSRILTSKDLIDLSSEKLNFAIEQFEKIGDLKRQADALQAQSWLDHQQKNYTAIKASLLKSARLALKAKDKQREIGALTYLSILAYKEHQENDKYQYLLQAENKMKDYQLPVYHFAVVPFHYAIFAEKKSDKEPHLKQVLEFTTLTPDHWMAHESRQQLVQYYIEQNRLEEAGALVVAATTDNAQNSYLKTILAKANKQTDVFVTHAQRTFEQAQLAGYRSLSLNVALLLCSEPNTSVNYDFYSQYINENATTGWLHSNEKKLVALNL